MLPSCALSTLAAFLPAWFAIASVDIKTGHQVVRGRYIIGHTTTVPTTTTTTTTTTSTTRSTTTRTTPTTTTTSSTTTSTTTTTPSTTSTTTSTPTPTTRSYSYGRQGIKGALICLQNKFTSGHFCCIRGVKDATGEPICDYFPRKTETRCFTLGVLIADAGPFSQGPIDLFNLKSEGSLNAPHEYDDVINSTCCCSRKIGHGLCCTDGLTPNLQAMECIEDGARTESGATCY